MKVKLIMTAGFAAVAVASSAMAMASLRGAPPADATLSDSVTMALEIKMAETFDETTLADPTEEPETSDVPEVNTGEVDETEPSDGDRADSEVPTPDNAPENEETTPAIQDEVATTAEIDASTDVNEEVIVQDVATE